MYTKKNKLLCYPHTPSILRYGRQAPAVRGEEKYSLYRDDGTTTEQPTSGSTEQKHGTSNAFQVGLQTLY